MVSLGNIPGFIIDKIKSITNFQNNPTESSKKASINIFERLKNCHTKQLHNTSNIKDRIIAWIDGKRGPTLGDIWKELDINKGTWESFSDDLKKGLIKGDPDSWFKAILKGHKNNKDKFFEILSKNISAVSQTEGIYEKLIPFGIGIRNGEAVNLLQELSIDKEIWNNFPKDLKELLVKGEFKEGQYKKLGAGNFGTVYSVGKEEKFVIKISKNTVNDPNEDEDKLGNNLVMSRIQGRDTEGVYVKGVDFITKHYGGMPVKVENDVKYLNIFQRADGKSGDKFFESDEFKNMSWQKRNDILIQFAKAVNTLHSVGLVHQDLKPENLQIYYDKTTSEVSVKVMDFGTTGTKTDAQGTPMFMKKDIAGLKKDIYGFGASMLFNFFPEHKELLSVFLMGQTTGAAEAGKAVWGNAIEKGIIELKDNLTAKGTQYTSKDDFINYIRTSDKDPVSIQWFSSKFDVNFDKLLDYITSEEGRCQYDTQPKAFLKEFFKQTLATKTPPSMEQIVGALEIFNRGGISAEGIFDKANADNLKRIPEYLLQEVEKAKNFDIQDKEAHKAFIAKVDELTDFIEQNPDYISDKDRERLKQLGLFVPNQTEETEG